MRARPRAAAAVIIAASLALTACGRGAAEQAGGSASPAAASQVPTGPAKGTVEVWAMGTEGEKLGELARAFEQDNPEVTIKVTAIPWDSAHDKIATAIAGQQTPDVSLVGTTWMGEFARAGALEPTPAGIEPQAFFPGAWDSAVVDGTAYGVPWYVETRVVYYRKDLAARAGLTPPRSWAELTAFARGLHDKAGATWGLSLQPGGTGSWQTFLPFAWQAGATLTTPDQSAFTLDTPAFVRGLSYYRSFFDTGLSPTDLPQGSLEPDFVKGRIGAFVSGPWHLGILADVGGEKFLDKVGLAPMPTVAGGDRPGPSFIGGGDLVVFKGSAHRDAAWQFVRWLSQPDTQVRWYRTVNDLPAVRKAWDDPTLAGDRFLSVFGDQLATAQAPPALPTWEQVANVIDTETERVIRGGEPPQQAATTIQQKATAIGTGTRG